VSSEDEVIGRAGFRKNARITLILPTHNHASTLAWAVSSAQRQTFDDLNIVVIGDGVESDTRDAISPLLKQDSRITFLDLPKGQRHGEAYRDAVIRAVESPIIAYTGDDDLLFDNHLETMVSVLEGRDFAHPLPIFVEADGSLNHIPTDISRQDCIDWHMQALDVRNAISLTGAVHSRSSYLKLSVGWSPAAVGFPTDLNMWRKFFGLDNFKGATGERSTTMKFSANVRSHQSSTERELEIKKAWDFLISPDSSSIWNPRVEQAVRESAIAYLLNWTWTQNENRALHNELGRLK